MGVLLWHIPLPVYLLTPDSAVSPGQHEWYAQSGHIPKAAATLTSKHQSTSANFMEEETLPIHTSSY